MRSSLTWLSILGASTLVLAAGCSSPSSPQAVSLSSIEITSARLTLAKGTSQQLVATGIYSDHSRRDLTTSVTWLSSSAEVAGVSDAEPKGLATAGGVGTTTITALEATSGVEGSVLLTVTPAVLVSVGVTPAAPSVARGTTRQLAATGVFSDSTTQDLTGTVTWSSSDASVASFSDGGVKGLATAGTIGTATLTALDVATGVQGTTVLTVTPAVLVSLGVTPAAPSRAKGTSEQLAATGVFSDGSTQDLTGSVAWSSSDASIASVSSAGVATWAAVGTATVTATDAASSIQGTTVLTVTPAVIAQLQVTPTSPSVAEGSTKQFHASATYTDGSTQTVTTAVTWSSSDLGIATISNASGSHGLASSVAAGTATITATDPTTQAQGSATLTVTPAVLTSITVTPATQGMQANALKQLTATGNYGNGTTQDLTSSVTWSSSNGVVTMSNASGSQGLAASGGTLGTATVTATHPTAGVHGSTTLTVGKRVFITATYYRGNLGGIAGADAKCAADANKPSTGTYKAMLGDAGVRAPCDGISCGGAHSVDWVLRPLTPYVQTDGRVVGTANALAALTPSQAGSLHQGDFWTGLGNDWTATSLTCDSWTNSTSTVKGTLAGRGSFGTYDWWCGSSLPFACVEQ